MPKAPIRKDFKLEKWARIEELLNHLIANFSAMVNNLVDSLTPGKVKNTLETSKKKVKERKEHLKTKAIEKSSEAISKIKNTKEEATKKVALAQEKAAEIKSKAKETKVSDFKWAKISAVILAAAAPAVSKIKGIFAGLQPQTVVTFVALSTVGTLAGLNIYKESKNIEEKAQAQSGELVEEVKDATAASRRPAYFKKQEKQFRLNNIVLPAYLEKSKGLKKLVIDFTVEGSNKYIKAYFWNNPHLIQDVLNSRVEPISVDFPLEDEGKTIVKDKIKEEIKKLLEKQKIKGEIKEVYIHSIIGG